MGIIRYHEDVLEASFRKKCSNDGLISNIRGRKFNPIQLGGYGVLNTPLCSTEIGLIIFANPSRVGYVMMIRLRQQCWIECPILRKVVTTQLKSNNFGKENIQFNSKMLRSCYGIIMDTFSPLNACNQRVRKFSSHISPNVSVNTFLGSLSFQQ